MMTLFRRAFGGSPKVARESRALPIAINHATAEQIAFGIAENVAPIDDAKDEWVMISPYGEHKNSQGIQVVSKEAADAMVAAFNSVFSKLGRLFRGVPIYVGHPDVRPDIWKDHRRYGKVLAMEARADGLYGKVSWNDIGQQNIKEGYFVYPSPAWYFKKLADGRIMPINLKSIGLTNSPNIEDSVPWTNDGGPAAASAGQFEANNPASGPSKARKVLTTLFNLPEIAGDQEINEAAEKMPDDVLDAIKQVAAKNKAFRDPGTTNARESEQTTTTKGKLAVNEEEKKKLCEALGLDPAKTTAEQLLTAVNTLTPLKQAATEAVDRMKKYRDVAINAELTSAIDKGRITAAEKEDWKTKLETDFDKHSKELREKQPAMNTQRLNLQPTDETDFSNPRNRRIAYNARLDELMAPDKDGRTLTLDQALDKMRANPKDRALLDAMNKSDQPATKAA